MCKYHGDVLPAERHVFSGRHHPQRVLSLPQLALAAVRAHGRGHCGVGLGRRRQRALEAEGAGNAVAKVHVLERVGRDEHQTAVVAFTLVLGQGI